MRTSSRNDYRKVQWNSSGPSFHLKLETMGLDLILYWKARNYWKVILLNLKKCFYVIDDLFFSITRDINKRYPDNYPRGKSPLPPPSLNYPRTIIKGINIFFCYQNRHIKNLFQKLSISKIQCSSFEIWDCQWLKTLSLTPGFTALILLLLFQFIKICLCYRFTFTHFFFFLTATSVLASSWLTFSNTRITVFFLFLILFSHGSLMGINSTHVCFRGWIMLWKTDDEKQKDKNTFKDNSQSGYFIY